MYNQTSGPNQISTTKIAVAQFLANTSEMLKIHNHLLKLGDGVMKTNKDQKDAMAQHSQMLQFEEKIA